MKKITTLLVAVLLGACSPNTSLTRELPTNTALPLTATFTITPRPTATIIQDTATAVPEASLTPLPEKLIGASADPMNTALYAFWDASGINRETRLSLYANDAPEVVKAFGSMIQEISNNPDFDLSWLESFSIFGHPRVSAFSGMNLKLTQETLKRMNKYGITFICAIDNETLVVHDEYNYPVYNIAVGGLPGMKAIRFPLNAKDSKELAPQNGVINLGLTRCSEILVINQFQFKDTRALLAEEEKFSNRCTIAFHDTAALEIIDSTSFDQ